jgi:hypothetical protein
VYVVRGSGSLTSCTTAIGCEFQVWDISNLSSPSYVGGGDGSGSTNSGTTGGAYDAITVVGRNAYLSGFASITDCSSTIGCEIQIWDVTGLEATSLVAGSMYAGTLTVGANGQVAGDFNIQGSTTVGQALYVNGGITSGSGIVIASTGNTGNIALSLGSTTSNLTLTLPSSLPGASNYCIVSTNLGALSFSACGASSTATVTLSPEFPGAVLTADGTNNTGTMTSDFCSGSGSGGININAAICDGATATAHNYYAWTASATNDYDVWTQWQVPTDWASFSSITFSAKVSTTTSDSVVLTIYKVGQTTACGSGTMSTGTTWQTSSSISTASCTLSPGDKIYFDAKLTVGVTSDFARLGEINIVYNRS